MPADIKAWPPTHYSAPLSEDFPSDADWLLPLVAMAYRLPDGKPVVLDDWQGKGLLRAILETFPPGHPRAGELRYRQVLVSLARQNGKSLLGAILALYGLIREAGALVIGIASSADQARIIYARLLKALRSHPSLAKRFQRITDTRGIEAIDGSRYEVKAAKSAAVQGLDVSLGLVDELHLTPAVLWADMVNGARSRRNGLIVGVTTAGDDTSALLLDLYVQAGLAPDPETEQYRTPHERFGYFVWEAPGDDIPEDDATLGEYLCAASPALACGRLDLDVAIADARSMDPTSVKRYLFNRFVSSSNSFVSLDLWAQRQGEIDTDTSGWTFAIDRTLDWSWATITASRPAGDGTVHTQVVASVKDPSVQKLADLCVELARWSPSTFVYENYALKALGEELKRRGLPTLGMTSSDIASASALFYSMIKSGRLVHAGDELLTRQLPGTVRKNVGTGFRVSRADSAAEIDAVISTVIGVYTAEMHVEVGSQLF